MWPSSRNKRPPTILVPPTIGNWKLVAHWFWLVNLAPERWAQERKTRGSPIGSVDLLDEVGLVIPKVHLLLKSR